MQGTTAKKACFERFKILKDNMRIVFVKPLLKLNLEFEIRQVQQQCTIVSGSYLTRQLDLLSIG